MFCRKFFMAVMFFFVGNIFFVNFAHAEMKNYIGNGFFAVENQTLDFAKNKAKLDAQRDISEQIFVEVQSNTEIKNSAVTRDEIILMSESFMKILDVKYKIEPAEENSFVVHAIVNAEVDTDEIENILKNRKG